MYERQPPRCQEPRDLVRARSKSNPVYDDSAKLLSKLFMQAANGQYCQQNEEMEVEAISANLTSLTDYMDTPKGLKYKGINKVIKNHRLIAEQAHYKADMIVQTQTGKILAIGDANEIDPEIVYGEHSVTLELQMLIDNEEYVQDYPDYRQYHFAVNGTEDPETCTPLPLEMVLPGQACEVIKATERIFNDQPA